MNDTAAPPRLTSLAHGGGCGCKIAPGVLAQILADSPLPVPCEALLVGRENNEDAAVWRLDDSRALVATTDFFTPVVDDPEDFGRIAATNAISDVYAMGAQPLFALAILGMPVGVLPRDTIGRILRAGESVCREAGIPVAGGHSIDTVEPIYGLVVVGLAHPDHIRRNSTGQAGDSLILGKPLGVGILSAALKQGRLDAPGYAQMIAHTTRLNLPGVALGRMPQVHALTDVTGFGLAGHLLEMCRGAGLGARLDWSDVPLIAQAAELARAGVRTGASGRNWTGYGDSVDLPADFPPAALDLLTDPQTSGGLLVACAPAAAAQVLAVFHEGGFHDAAVIGQLVAGPARLAVQA